MLLRAHATRQFVAPQMLEYGRGHRRKRDEAAAAAAAAAAPADEQEAGPADEGDELLSIDGGSAGPTSEAETDAAAASVRPAPPGCAGLRADRGQKAPKRIRIIPPRRPESGRCVSVFLSARVVMLTTDKRQCDAAARRRGWAAAAH
jgi:hypothetical protein